MTFSAKRLSGSGRLTETLLGTPKSRTRTGEYERLGDPHLLVGLNCDERSPRTILVNTGFGPRVVLHDYTGRAPDRKTDDQGRLSMTLPPNHDDGGYVADSKAGITRQAKVVPCPVTQVFEEASDLDLSPAIEGQEVQVCRVWCAAHTVI